MTHQNLVHSKVRGFTLIEAILYVGLFGIMFTGIFISIYPLFTGAERLSRNIVAESESAFVVRKIQYALTQGITSATALVATPVEGDTTGTSELIIKSGSTELFRFEEDPSNTFCSPPRVCHMLVYSENREIAQPLNAERVSIENFKVKHYAPSGDAPRYLEISFTANGILIGPIKYYVRF